MIADGNVAITDLGERHTTDDAAMGDVRGSRMNLLLRIPEAVMLNEMSIVNWSRDDCVTDVINGFL